MIEAGAAAIFANAKRCVDSALHLSANFPGLEFLKRNSAFVLPAVIGVASLCATVNRWFAILIAAILIYRAMTAPKMIAAWIFSVGAVWTLVLWATVGFLAFSPWSWVELSRRWNANEIVGWLLPIMTAIASTIALGVPKSTIGKIVPNVPKIFLRNFAGFFLTWIFLASCAKIVLGEASILIRTSIFFGALIVGGFLNSVKRYLVDSAKGAVLTSAERESADIVNVHSARVASVIKEEEPSIKAQSFQSAERIISVNSFSSEPAAGDDLQALADIDAALGSEPSKLTGEYLDFSKGISQRDLAALFDGTDEGDYESGACRYGLLRHLWDRSTDLDSNEAAPNVTPVAEPEVAVPGAEPAEVLVAAADEASARAGTFIVDDYDPDDLSGPGVIEAVAEAAKAAGSMFENIADFVADRVADEHQGDDAVAEFIGDPEIEPDANEAPRPEVLALRHASSKATRVVAVFKRLKAEGRLETDLASRLLPLMDDALEETLVGSEDGRELLEAKRSFLSRAEFDGVEIAAVAVASPEPETPEAAHAVAAETDPSSVAPAVAGPEDFAEAFGEAAVSEMIAVEEPTAPASTEEPVQPIGGVEGAALVAIAEVDGAQLGGAIDAPQTENHVSVEAAELLENIDVNAHPKMTEISAPVVEQQLDPIKARIAADELVIANLREWLGIEPVQLFDIDRMLDERGRERPDEQEIDISLRRLKEYAPSPTSRRNAIREMSSLLSKDDEEFSIEDACLLKAIFGMASDESCARWGFSSSTDASRKFVFLVFHDFVAAKVGDIEQRLKEGFSNIDDVKAYRIYTPLIEELPLAFPQMGQMVQDFLAQLDKAEFDFALADGQAGNLLIEGGLVDGANRSAPGVSVNLGVSRLLASRMPVSAQEALSRFMNIGKLIEPIDLMIIDEGVRSGEAPEKHPMFPMLMELQYRGLLEIRGLMDELKRRPLFKDQIPSIIRTRHDDLGSRYESILRNQEEIERTVLKHREDALQLRDLGLEVVKLKAALEERDQAVRDSEEAAKRLPVMDALVSAVRQVADRDERLSVVGKSYLKAEVGPDELAVAFIHGHNLQWRVDGTKLCSEDGSIDIDLLRLCHVVRQSHGFSDEGGTRLRVVLVAGTFGIGRPNFAFTVDEIMQEPAKLFGTSDFDAVAARTLGF